MTAEAYQAVPPTADGNRYQRLKPEDQTENPYVNLISNQKIVVIPQFVLESGVTLKNVPVAYKTYGTLSFTRDNVIVICHALTGSADVGDWWGPLIGGPDEPGKDARAFDLSRFFVFCANSLGSPYGSASPVTAKDGIPGKERYGPEFPLTTVRDDVNIFKLLLDDLGVKQVAAVVGGSMGGMLVLEFAYFGADYVRTIVPIATSARCSAWGISWSEAQRQSIYSDLKYNDGYYPRDDPPATGMAAARMSALLTYRSRDSFEARFGRHTPEPACGQEISGAAHRPSTPDDQHFAVHNDGHRNVGSPRLFRRSSSDVSLDFHTLPKQRSRLTINNTNPRFSGNTRVPVPERPSAPKKKCVSTYYSAQSYLRHQGQKFTKRFDANCYIAMTRKLDTHDVSRRRDGDDTTHNNPEKSLRSALALITQPSLVLGIESDGLFTFAEQRELASGISNAELKVIDSPEGHDAFLIEFRQVNRFVLDFFEKHLPDIMAPQPITCPPAVRPPQVVKASTFGEAEVNDIIAW